MSLRASVPCDGCKVCCVHEAIVLHPEQGDDVASYETTAITHPFTGNPAFRLQQRPNGECTYLTDAGCSIWDRAPVICKKFDCRLFFLKFNRDQRRQMLSNGTLDKATIDAGRKRLGSL